MDRRWAPSASSLRNARRLLDLEDEEELGESRPPSSAQPCSSLTKTQIQRAFARAAQRHHPDGRHRPGARPCAVRFRECHEARRLLLDHYVGGDGGAYRRRDAQPRYRRPPPSDGVFDRILRGKGILTLKQNLTIRAIVLTVLTVGTLYDDWSNKRVTPEIG